MILCNKLHNMYILVCVLDFMTRFDSISKKILNKMILYNVCGGKHHGLDDLKRCFPSHVKGDVEKAIKKLVKSNFILKHSTSYGFQYSLNHDKIDEIGDGI